jgi:putative addiction module killer protein
MPLIREYVDARGRSPFAEWFEDLDARTAAKIAVARIEMGNLSNVKGVGGGVLEYRIDWGPGYPRVFRQGGRDARDLLAGGTKKRQRRDIAVAQDRWVDYRRRQKEEG